MSLHPCPSCAQHLRTSETVCPFCDAVLPASFAAFRRTVGARGRPTSRAAFLFAAATVAAGCGASTESSFSGDAGHDAAHDGAIEEDSGQPVALYGPGPIYDSGPGLTDAAKDGGADAPEEEDSGPGVMYGPAPIDGGLG